MTKLFPVLDVDCNIMEQKGTEFLRTKSPPFRSFTTKFNLNQSETQLGMVNSRSASVSPAMSSPRSLATKWSNLSSQMNMKTMFIVMLIFNCFLIYLLYLSYRGETSVGRSEGLFSSAIDALQISRTSSKDGKATLYESEANSQHGVGKKGTVPRIPSSATSTNVATISSDFGDETPPPKPHSPTDKRLAVLVYSLYRPDINRYVHYDWWSSGKNPTADHFTVYGYNISRNRIDAYGTATLNRTFSDWSLGKIPGMKGRELEKQKQWQQNLDVQTILKHWMEQKCHGHDIFLIAEDDIRPCNGTMLFFRFVQQWAQENDLQWGIIRLGVGLTSTILKCSYINELIRFLNTSQHYEKHAVDASISRFLMVNPQYGRERVFRYALTDHASEQSTIWNPDYLRRRNKLKVPPCFGPIVWDGSFSQSSYDLAACSASLFSPCDDLDASMNAFVPPMELLNPTWTSEYRTQKAKGADATRNGEPAVPITADSLAKDLSLIDSVVIAPAGVSCTKHCASLHMTCKDNFLKAINRCDIMLDSFEQCTSCQYRSFTDAPVKDSGICYLQWSGGGECDAVPNRGGTRLCACTTPGATASAPAPPVEQKPNEGTNVARNIGNNAVQQVLSTPSLTVVAQQSDATGYRTTVVIPSHSGAKAP